MAAEEHPLVEQSTVPVVSDAADASSKPDVRPALFLRPRAGDDGAAPPAPPGDPGRVPGCPRDIEAVFRGWSGVPRQWPEWVAKLRRRHEPLWREVGILDGILASTCRVRRREHEHALLPLAAFWSAATGTFVFPWGEATLTLEDVATLAGLPLLGVPVRAPVPDDLYKDVGAIEAIRAVLNRSKQKKAAYCAWMSRFVERTPEEEAQPSAAGGTDGDGAARELLEHGAFLSMWLSLFVLPGPPFDVVRREVLPLAARLARGQSVALAPAALATIYHDLSALKRHMTSGKKDEPFVVSAPIHILQLWVWEHFPQLSPEPAASSAPADHDMPRAARWHEVWKRLSSKDVHAVFMSPKEFNWRPYGNRSLFGLQPKMGDFWSAATSKTLLSLVRCLHACELVGMNCIQQYSPHRVARQLGFDQDIPGTVPRASSSWEKAWETYNIEAESSAFIFPNHKPSVTVQYAKWWKPYSSACGSAIPNATKMKKYPDFVSPVKRKMEGVLAGNSGKKLCLPVATANRGRPPNIPAVTNVYPSQSSGSHAAIRRAAAVPGHVLRACPPHLRFRAMSTTGMPQPVPDAGDDPLDQISLSERLNNITKMPKQPNTECLVKGGEQERTVESVKIFIPKSPSVGPKKAVIHKVTEQAFPDAVASSASIVDESSCGFVTERLHAKCFQQSKDEDLNTANVENSSRTEHCDVVLLNAVQGVVSSGRSEAIGAGTEDVMHSTHDDFLVISDGKECDKSSSKGHEVSAMHLKSHMSGAKMSLIRERNDDTKLVDARNGEQDSQVLKKVTKQGNFSEIVEISDDELDEETCKETGVFVEATSKVTKQGNFGDIVEISDDELDEETCKEAGVFVEPRSKEDALSTLHLKSPEMKPTQTILQECDEEKQMVRETIDEQDNRVMKEGTVLLNVVHGAVSTGRSEAIGAGTEVNMLPTHEDFLVISDDDERDKSTSKGHEASAMHLKSHMLGAKMSLIRERNEDTKLVDARNDEQDSQVLKKVTTDGNFGEIVEISDDELVEEMGKEAGVFAEAMSKEDALGTMHMKSPKMEAMGTILQECNGEKQMVSETNDEQDNQVMKEGTVQNSCDCQFASVQDDITLTRQPDVLTHAATVQTYDVLLQGPTEELDTGIDTGDVDNTDNVPNENGGSLNFSEKGKEDILLSNEELEHPMEHSARASRKKSGNSERFSSRLLDGNTKLVSHEVCTKTLYYVSRFDRMKDAWDKDANNLPRRAVGTMETIKRASAIRQAEMAGLRKKINTLKEEIRALEAAEKGNPQSEL